MRGRTAPRVGVSTGPSSLSLNGHGGSRAPYQSSSLPCNRYHLQRRRLRLFQWPWGHGRQFPFVRALFGLLLLLRFGYNIIWVHNQGIYQRGSGGLSLGPFILELQRQTMANENGSMVLSLPHRRRVGGRSITISAAAAKAVKRRKPIVFKEMQRTQKLNLQRQLRTTPPPQTLPGIPHNASDSFSLVSGPWQRKTKRIIMPWKHNWQLLCENANLDADSRVMIINILTQPPGQALALFLAKQCGVRGVMGIDQLFPNHQRDRLDQMDAMRELETAIDRFELVVPTVDPREYDELSRQRMAEFAPTHVIHLATSLPDFESVLSSGRSSQSYLIQNGLQWVYDALQSFAVIDGDTMADRWQMPRFVLVTSTDTAVTSWTEISSLLVRTFGGLYNVSTTLLKMPPLYGPMVASPHSVSDYYMHEKMYVTNAMACILKGLEYSPMYRSIYTRQMIVDIDSAESVTPEITYYSLKRYHKRETGAWVETYDYDHLGNSVSEADYIDFYGVPRNHFPCASKCRDNHCTPSVFDEIQDLVQDLSDGCVNAVYHTNFSKSFEYIERPKAYEKREGICRFAFVSGQSLLARSLVYSSEKESGEDKRIDVAIDAAVLREKNGRYKVNGWHVIWLPEHDESTMSEADLALLRIDPAAMFAESVELALYTERIAFMKATDSRLIDVFKEMKLSRIGPKMRRVKRPGTSVWQMVKIPRQVGRRVMFYAKAPSTKLYPKSLDDFVHNAKTRIPEKQILFYNRSTSLIMSTESRPEDEVMSSEYEEFPFEWISADLMIHELGSRYSKQFRCTWLKEFLFWGGQRDSELLSFAYTMGKRRIEGLYGSPQPREAAEERDVSWYPIMEGDDFEERARDGLGHEVFLRIIHS